MKKMREIGEMRAGFAQTLPSIAIKKFLNPPLQTMSD